MLAWSTTDYQRARELEPYIAYRYYSLADVYVYWAQQGASDKWSTALSLYDSASQLFPGNAVIVNKQALALIIKGDFSEARTKLDYAASLDPEWAETSFLSGLLLAREGKISEAAAEILKQAHDGQACIEGIDAEDMNFVAAIWFAEFCHISDSNDPDVEDRREWMKKVRRSLPSCFCDPADLP